MFSIVGNINFRTRLKAFEGLFDSFLTIMNYSLGTFDFQIFKNIPDLEKRLYGQLFTMIVVFSFNMLILNMIIAVLANTYSIFDGCSKGLYLSEILITRDVLNYDRYCGAFLFAIPLISLIQIPFVPIALFLPYGSPTLARINNLVMQIQYCIYMSFSFAVFVIFSFLLIPLAWVVGIVDKLGSLSDLKNHQDKILNVYLFIPFGIPILLFDFVADIIYFWKNNFRVQLKKIIIERERSKLSHKTLRDFMKLCENLTNRKIKSIKSESMLKILQARFKLKSNIQYLIFGQIIPEGGFHAD